MKYFPFILLILISACTTTEYTREENGVKVKVSHFSLGMEREDVNLNFSRKPDGMDVGINIGRSSGKESFDRVIGGLESTLETLKSMRP